MSSPYQVRRATLDDIEPLTRLWNSMRFNAEDLARRVTEFQVAVGPDGNIVGAVGLQLIGRQGLIHSEAFTDFALAEAVRPALWERLNSVANNHGLHRIWTQEQAPFWNHCGLQTPDAEALQKLPAEFAGRPGPWKTLKLREELEQLISADKEFALFMQAERQRSQRALQHARMLKFLATLIALALLGVVMVGVFLVLRQHPGLLRR